MRSALCCDIHPNGLLLSIGFKEGLKVYILNLNKF